MSLHYNNHQIESIRYLLQVAAHHDTNILHDEYINLLNDIITACSDDRADETNTIIKTILDDLNLHNIQPKNGSVLENIKQCLIPDDIIIGDEYKIIYNCFDRSIPPQIVSRPDILSNKAIIVVDTVIFSGFTRKHYNYLKRELGIEYVKIIYGHTYNITDGYELLSKHLKKEDFSDSIEFDITERGMVIILIIIGVIIVAISPKIFR